jgi:hypothetical protein
MRKLALALLFVLLCTVTVVTTGGSGMRPTGGEEVYVIEIKNVTTYNKVIMVYNDSKEPVHQIGLDHPQISIKLKPQESQSIELTAGNYSIIEKIPSLNHYTCYSIVVPEDVASGEIIELLKKGKTL